jgi:Ser/Thr protein kinase RdoA (MazF antagonist)
MLSRPARPRDCTPAAVGRESMPSAVGPLVPETGIPLTPFPHADSSLDRAAATVRARYSAVFGSGPLVPLGNRGGFSGARLWRGDTVAGPFCLRAWPPAETLSRVQGRHRLMALARAAGLSFIPTVFPAADGATAVGAAGRLWEMTEWLPGVADFAERPSRPRLAAACTSLARLHRAWEAAGETAGPCPAVRRRLDLLREWLDLVRAGWQPFASPAAGGPVREVAERAWRLLPAQLAGLPDLLEPWLAGTRPLQPCLCDVWHDHLLFEGDRLTGIVDYGAVKMDHVAVDLARLLGSLVGDDADGWDVGIAAYRAVRPLAADEEELARVLDRAGTLLGAANWLRRLYRECEDFEDLAAVAGRLRTLVERIERWTA